MTSSGFVFADPDQPNEYFAFDPVSTIEQLAADLTDELGGDVSLYATRSPGGITLDVGGGGWTDSLRGLPITPGWGLGGLVAATGKPLAIDDYHHSPAISHEYDHAVRTEGLVSLLALPVFVDGGVVAVAYVARRHESNFDDVAMDRGLELVAKAEEEMAAALKAEHIARAAIEEERRRTAEQLHDSVGAMLFAIEAGATRLGEVVEGNEEISDRAREIVETASAAGSALRESIAGLVDTDPGLSLVALRADLRQLERRSGITGALVLPDGLPELSEHTAGVLIATERELLRNVERHSGADRVVVTVLERNEGVSVVTVDNGTGTAGDLAEGVGLSGCRTRLEQLGGSLTFHNDDDEPGLTVKAWVPR